MYAEKEVINMRIAELQKKIILDLRTAWLQIFLRLSSSFGASKAISNCMCKFLEDENIDL